MGGGDYLVIETLYESVYVNHTKERKLIRCVL